MYNETCIECDTPLIDGRCPNPDCSLQSVEGYIKQLKDQKKTLLEALRKIAYEPIGKTDATDREILSGIEEIAKQAIAKVEGAIK